MLIALCDKLELESRLDSSLEAFSNVNLTPYQVKEEMKHYVALCEKKIASQQTICKELQQQVKQLIETVSLIASPNKGISSLSMAMNMNLTSVENMLLNSNINCLDEKDILYATSIKSIEKLLILGANIDYIDLNVYMIFPGFDTEENCWNKIALVDKYFWTQLKNIIFQLIL
jgi:hypothetical protein